MCVFVSPPPFAHHVQAATVHQRSELMQTDLCGVQYSLDLLQTSLEINKEHREQAQVKNSNKLNYLPKVFFFFSKKSSFMNVLVTKLSFVHS